MGLLNNVIRTAVVSMLGAKLARGRSPIVAALLMLLVSKAFAKRDDTGQEREARDVPGPGMQGEGGLGGLIEQFRRGGFEDIIKSWIGTGPNKSITANQLHQALGPDTVSSLERETGMPRDDLLSQLSRLLPEVIDKLTPEGKLPKEQDLLPEPVGAAERRKEAEEEVAADLNEAAHHDTRKKR
jgi:uncharacterized protein YidB (DUF937 family)